MTKKNTLSGEEEFQRNVYELQRKRFEIFKSQDLEIGRFDVTFEIEEKKLHAHQFIVTSVSETLNSWITDRWINKDEPIKIETYSYSNFCELIRFIYIGSCELSKENVYDMVDIAEFYGVECLKNFCVKFLSKMEKSAERIEEMYEFAIKYSLKQFESSIKEFIFENFDAICKFEKFNGFKKDFVEFLATIRRHDSFEGSTIAYADRKKEGNFFEAVYKWAENQVIQQKAISDGSCNLHNAIEHEFKIVLELQTILPQIEFSKMSLDFLKNFVVEKGFILSPSQLAKSFSYFRKHYDSAENLFKAVYELAEKQALQKMFSYTESFNLQNTIKADLAQIIPRVKFYKMEKQFLNDFVAAKGLITEEQISHIWDTQIQIKNGKQLITASFKDEIGIRRAIQKREKQRYETKQKSNRKLRFTLLKFSIPKAPSTLLKMVGVEWYLCLEKDGIVTFKHESMIDRSDYLIAEMESNTPFVLNTDCSSCLTAGYRNI